MATDVLILGPVEFDGFATPSKMPIGGKHAMAVHKLPGGGRVFDMLGPDEADISWQGLIYDDAAVALVETLDGMRRSGRVWGLSYAGRGFPVVVSEFVAEWKRYPVMAEYRVTCTIVTAGEASAAGVDAQVGADVASAKDA